MENILRFDEIDSTNTYLKTHCTMLPEKTIVVADRQTAGRGRYDRKWISQAGGLYFSVLLKPHKTDFLPNFTQLMALCICQAAEELGVQAVLKWPNDVLAEGKKLCGILSEAVVNSSGVQGLVLGVGVNVAQEDLSQVGQAAVSLKELGVNVTKDEFLARVLSFFWREYPAVEAQGFEVLRQAYLQRFAFIGRKIAVKNGKQTLKGVAQDISPRGTLLLATAKGVQEIYIGDLIV